MSSTLKRVQALAARGELRISAHGYDELAADGLLARDVIAGISDAIVVEDYPTFPKGPCVLVLQIDPAGEPIHAVWGIPAGKDSPGVLVTAYRPDPGQWDATFRLRL
jgi:hypothetical protein